MAELDIRPGCAQVASAVVLVGILAGSLPPAALAQTAATTGDETIEEIVVTGSRLIRRDFVAPSPILTIEREALEFSGQGTLETVLNQMPQVTPGMVRTTNNGSDGTAQVNLRGLGSGRTLVMLNGRRVAPSGIGTAVDINNLPQVLIERVEVITGGATTVYGSDAVAGVVNFITRDDFDGFGFDVSGYTTEKGDSNIYDFNATYGHNFANGRGNITLFAGYYDREETFADARELSSVAWLDTWEGELVQGGSPSVPEGAVSFPRVDFGNGPAQVIFDADGDPREFIFPDDRYNYAPANYLQTPLTRYAGGLFFNYGLSSRAEAYAEAAFARNEHRSVLAPVPVFGFFLFNTDNPVMTPATRQLFADNYVPEGPNLVSADIRRRLEELGPRITENNHDYLRILAGVRGDIWTDWDFDAWITYTDADESILQLNDASQSRFQQGVLVDPVTGQCFDPSNGCVPINWFGRGNLSPEAVEFIRLPPLEDVTSRTQLLASAFVRGRLFDTWAGGVQSAFGIEWRSDDGSYKADDYLFTGDTLGYLPSSPVNGKETVYEAYAEMLIPLAEDAAFADYLGLEIGGRHSEYDHAGGVDTWKAGLDWQPIASLRFRSMLQHSVRAPNLYEAFEEQRMNDDVFAELPQDDPCSAVSDPVGAGNVEKCIATGLPADQIGIFDATPLTTIFISGGNPDLEPEVADTLTAGFILTPQALPNVQIAIDYFDIEIDGEIADLAAADACFDPANVNNLFCDSIKRDPIT